MNYVNVGDFTRASVVEHGDRLAILDLSAAEPRAFSYSELEVRVRQSVSVLRALGLGRGDKIALALPNSVEFLEIFLGAMRLGAVPVLVNFQLGESAIRFVLRDSASRAVIADPTVADVCCRLADDLGIGVRMSIAGSFSSWHIYPDLALNAVADSVVESMEANEQAFQPYTAGSTGVPKGICLTHGGVSWGIEHSQRYWPVRIAERGIVAAPMYHKNAMRGTVKPMLRGGGSVVILRRFEPRGFIHALAEHRVTHCGGVPAMFAELLKHADILASANVSALKVISLGSSNVTVELIERLQRAFPKADVRESYGLTEGDGPLRPPLDGRKTPHGSVGVCAPETEVMLVDSGGSVAAEGELWVRSPYVLREYVNRPDLTTDRICEGWLRTGDLFHRDAEGFYYFRGRTDDMFVCGGENIYPKDVESLILGHADVADVVVAPLPHAVKGEAPVAAVTLRPGRSVQPQAIQDFCAAHGPPFAIPRAVLIVDALPMTGAGKPDRGAVRAMLTSAFGTLAGSNRGGAGEP